MKMTTVVFLLATIPIAAAQNLPTQPKADIIFLHGNIYTGVAACLRFTPTRAPKPWPFAMAGSQP